MHCTESTPSSRFLTRVSILISILSFLACGLSASFALEGAAAPESEARLFADPPESARPWVYWMWMDGNLSAEGITADLEAMKQAGIGGVIIMEVNAGIPRGPVEFMSPEWRQLFRHVVREAERLGLEITLNAGPGWTGSGGPWVPPESSMQFIVAATLDVTGPSRFEGALPRPARRPAFFGDGALPAAAEKAKDEFYRDVAVLAFPTPKGTRRIGDIDEKALYVRAPYSSQAGVRTTFPAPAEHAVVPADEAVDTARTIDLSGRLSADGRLAWEVPEGQWTIVRFGRTCTGANTRPAPIPGLGLECDKLDKAALDAHFEAFVGTLLRELGPREMGSGEVVPGREGARGWTSLHIDSWEMGSQNWTAAFREEFRRRRGYDLLCYLPALAGLVVDSLERSERFLWDLRTTAQELVIENHAEHLRALGRRHGLGLSIEPYDMNPAGDMTLGAVADVPMGEFWRDTFDATYSVIEAVSTAHTCGRRIVGAESFTSGGDAWQAHPGSLKALGDWALAAGVNRIVFHRSQHQPWLDLRPGMTMGPYGVHWERTQTWWASAAPAFHAYLARCQHLLRQGLPVADVCYLVAEGAPHVFRPPSSARRGTPPDPPEYAYDGCAPETAIARLGVKDGRLVLPDGMSYSILVLPDRDTMTPRLLAKVRDLVEAGAVVLGPRPKKSPSLAGYPSCDGEVRRLADGLWGPEDARGLPAGTPAAARTRAVGKGRVISTSRPGVDRGAGETALAALEGARWIWHLETLAASKADRGKRIFRRSFSLEAGRGIARACAFLTADNAFEIRVNDRALGSGSDFRRLFSFDVGTALASGENAIVIVAENGGDAPNPAGLIGALVVEYEGGERLIVPTDGHWEADLAPPERTVEAWIPAVELGPVGSGPWGRPTLALPEGEQYGEFAEVAEALRALGIPPDFESEAPLRRSHRKLGDRDLYFVANPADQAVRLRATFRAKGRPVTLWDPVDGSHRSLPEFEGLPDGRTRVPLVFEAHQSFFIEFGGSAPPPAEATAPRSNFPEAKPRAILSGAWELSFDPAAGGPAKVEFQDLEDWSRRPEEGIRFYSGTVVYRKTFALPAVASPPAAGRKRVLLDLGRVHEVARVRLNDRDLGVVWCAPRRVDITDALVSGENRLEIEVTNLWPNRLIGDERFPPDAEYAGGGNLAQWPAWILEKKLRPTTGRFTFSTWRHYRADSALQPSGLLGPVRILELE